MAQVRKKDNKEDGSENLLLYPDKPLFPYQGQPKKQYLYTFDGNNWREWIPHTREVAKENRWKNVIAGSPLLTYIVRERVLHPLKVIINVLPPFAYYRVLDYRNQAIAPGFFETKWGQSEDTRFNDYRKLWKEINNDNFWFWPAHRIVHEIEPLSITLDLRKIEGRIIDKFFSKNTDSPIKDNSLFVVLEDQAKLYTNLYGYLSGAIELCWPRDEVGLKIVGGDNKFVLLREHAPEGNVFSRINFTDDDIESRAILDIRPLLNLLNSTCRDQNRKAVFILGGPGTGKEFVKASLWLGKSCDYDSNRYKSMSAGGMATLDFQRQLFGARISGGGLEPGLLKELEGGSLFVDEICKGDKGIRSALLRVIEASEFTPVNATLPEKLGKRIFFIFAGTPKDKEDNLEPLDFWTRVEPFIKVPPLLPNACPLGNCESCHSRGLLKNLFLSFWTRCFEKEYRLEDLRKGTLGSAYKKMVDRKLEKYVGRIDDSNGYHTGLILEDKKVEEMLKGICVDSGNLRSPRAFGNAVGLTFAEAIRNEGKEEEKR